MLAQYGWMVNVVVYVPLVFYVLTLYRALQKCSPLSRKMEPGMVWLMLVPLFGFIWHVFVVRALYTSMEREFVARRITESLHRVRSLGPRMAVLIAACIVLELIVGAGSYYLAFRSYTYEQYIESGASLILALISFLALILGIVGLISWIIYWVRVHGYSERLSLPYQPAGAARSPVVYSGFCMSCGAKISNVPFCPACGQSIRMTTPEVPTG